VSKRYWMEMSEKCFLWHEEEPDMRWGVFMYFYLFKWAGYEESFSD